MNADTNAQMIEIIQNNVDVDVDFNNLAVTIYEEGEDYVFLASKIDFHETSGTKREMIDFLSRADEDYSKSDSFEYKLH